MKRRRIYNEYIKNDPERKREYDNPLRETLKKLEENTCEYIGRVCIENPDKSLNDIVESEKDDNYDNYIAKMNYDNYIAIFGNKSFYHADKNKIYDNYIKHEKELFNNTISGDKKYDTNLNNFKSLEELGEKLLSNKEKYGFDNPYDWRLANWGTKWNACDSNYDEESQQLNFDTAWAVPEPIFAKIAQDNPDITMKTYSEEEQGWFEEYELKDGLLNHTATGEYTYDEETDECIEHREEIKPVVSFTYNQIKEDYINSWKASEDYINNWKAYTGL